MRTGSPLNPDEPVTLTGSIPRISDVIMSVIRPPDTGCRVADAAAVAPGALVAPGAAAPPESSPPPAASHAPAERMKRHLRQFFIKSPPLRCRSNRSPCYGSPVQTRWRLNFPLRRAARARSRLDVA